MSFTTRLCMSALPLRSAFKIPARSATTTPPTLGLTQNQEAAIRSVELLITAGAAFFFGYSIGYGKAYYKWIWRNIEAGGQLNTGKAEEEE